MVFWNKDLLFCEISPLTYAISMRKEIIKRNLQDFLAHKNFARTIGTELLPNVVSSHQSNLIKIGPGIDPELQFNKAENIRIASNKISGVIIHPGQEFSFWKLVGKINKKSGYKDGRVIIGNQLVADIGGGLCNLANTLHLLVVHSPMDITELHTHSDALAPDEGKRVPFANGTSVAYNNQDYRFKNNTDQDIQIVIGNSDDNLQLIGELRSEKEFPWFYELVEEDHHFKKSNQTFYRNSKIYRLTRDKSTGQELARELILKNHSEVMFDYDLIPKDLIRK